MSIIVAFLLILSSIYIAIPISLSGTSMFASDLGLKHMIILVTLSLYMISSIIMNAINGDITKRMVSIDNSKLSNSDMTEMKTIICKTAPSKTLRILLS